MRLPFTEPKLDEGTPEQKAANLEALYKTADAARWARESAWYTNILFFGDRQWEYAAADIQRHTRLLVQTPQIDPKARVAANLIKPLVRQAAATMVKNLSRVTAYPASNEENDVDAAAIGTDFLEYRYHEDHEQDKRGVEVLWLILCGIVARWTSYDPDLASMLPTGKVEGAGDIDTSTLNPWQVHLCPWADSWRDLPWLIVSDVRDIDEINDTWPGHEVKEEQYSDHSRFLDQLLTGLVSGSIGAFPHGQNYGAPTRKNAAILKRLLAAPTPRYPKGRLFVWAAGKLLFEDDLPEGENPVTVFNYMPVPGSAYGMPAISGLLDLQREININLSQRIELKNRQLNPPIVVEGLIAPTEDAEGNVDHHIGWSRTDDGQRYIYVDPTVQGKPEFMRYDFNTNEADRQVAELWQYMQQVMGLHEPTMGGEISPSQTATTTLTLRDADLVGFTQPREAFDLDSCRVARLKLIIARENYAVPRMIRCVNDDGIRTMAFYGADLRHTEDVRPEPAPMLSEAQRLQVKSQLIAAGAYGPWQSPQHKLAMMEAILSSGLPDARKEVDRLCGTVALEDLRKVSDRLDQIGMELLLRQGQLALSPPEPTAVEPGQEAGPGGQMTPAQGAQGTQGAQGAQPRQAALA